MQLFYKFQMNCFAGVIDNSALFIFYSYLLI